MTKVHDVNWNKLADKISTAIAKPYLIRNVNSVAGGCINTAFQLLSDEKNYFVKFNSAEKLTMFEAESDGLLELAKANAIRVPEPVCTGVLETQSYIVMEDLSLCGLANHQLLARHLANLHCFEDKTFGWWRNNTIGSTLQINTQTEDWHSFWNNHRLGYQLDLVKQQGAKKSLLDKGERLQADLHHFFTGYEPKVSLLHGDLWSGNVGYTDSGQPVIFDPATYYGDREADIAMTELFGGFSEAFYKSYQELMPLDDGYAVRKELYNLYHILNHFNLFGGSYESQAERMCSRLLASI